MFLLYILEQPNYICIGVAGLVISIIGIKSIEKFQDVDDTDENNIKSLLTSSDDEHKDDIDDEETDDVDKDEDDDETYSDDDMSNEIDIGATFREAYNNLSPKQIENMTKDTKELVNSQKNLISTLKNLEPVVKQGINLLDKFKGKGSTTKLFEKLARNSNSIMNKNLKL
tara:strand:- start:1449 stop:1958 length:510 start_codon:yes stop_codon:yes gene_type:complete